MPCPLPQKQRESANPLAPFTNPSHGHKLSGMNTPVTERPITTTARFKCPCGIKVLLAGPPSTRFETLFTLQYQHRGHRSSERQMPS